MRRACLVVAFALAPFSRLTAQMAHNAPMAPAISPPLPEARTVPIATSLRIAEAEGERWPTASGTSTQPEDSRTRLLFTPAPRVCVEAVSRGPIRTGEFLVGGQMGGEAAVNSALRVAKVWWMPKFPIRNDSIMIRATRLGFPSDTLRFLDAPSGSGGRAGPWFFTVPFRMLKSGRWLVVATSGPNWGCVILEAL